MEEVGNAHNILIQNIEGRNQLEDVSKDMKVILNVIRKSSGEGLDSSDSG
jgi:hypothetical protein